MTITFQLSVYFTFSHHNEAQHAVTLCCCNVCDRSFSPIHFFNFNIVLLLNTCILRHLPPKLKNPLITQFLFSHVAEQLVLCLFRWVIRRLGPQRLLRALGSGLLRRSTLQFAVYFSSGKRTSGSFACEQVLPYSSFLLSAYLNIFLFDDAWLLFKFFQLNKILADLSLEFSQLSLARKNISLVIQFIKISFTTVGAQQVNLLVDADFICSAVQKFWGLWFYVLHFLHGKLHSISNSCYLALLSNDTQSCAQDQEYCISTVI